MRGNPTSPTGQTAALAAPKNAMGYTVTEAAKILGKHPNTIYAWTRPGCPLADARQIGSTFYIPGRQRPGAAARADTGDRGEWLCSALVEIRERIAAVLEDETADRQYALEQADSSLAGLIERWRASIGRAAAPASGEAGR